MRPPLTRALSLTAFALVLTALPAGLSAATGASPVSATVATEPSLPHAANGQEAIDLLGDSLDEAATLNGWTAAQLREVLRTDPTAWVDGTGRVYYKDPVAPAAPAGADPDDVAPFPLDQTFLLHSRPGSTKTLYLDVDGHNVSGTAWNQPPPVGSSLPNGNHPAWTLDGDAGTFNDAEKEAVQSIWQRVAEDYAPFNIDVTTQDPGDAGIIRTDPTDQVYGIRALISPSTAAQNAICGGPVCGGVAYINVFDQYAGLYQPAWVFPHSLSNNAKNIAEAVSHEAGHNFSLNHDGVTSTSFQSVGNCASVTGYYCGHANWSPIMGVGYYKPIAQWSKGEYAGANNTGQDDVALIAARVPYITDDAGGTTATASPTTAGTKYIAQASDQDVFALGSCSGSFTATAAPAPTSPNLDIQLDLLNSSGAVVVTNDPPSGTTSIDVASGLSASVSDTLAPGDYFLRVDGVGIGSGATGYTDYGSIGSYTVTHSVCGAGPTAPGVPTNLAVAPAANGQSATVTWAPPASDGGSPVTGYTLTRTGGTPVDLGLVGTHTWTGLTPGSAYTFTVAAKNAVGTGTAASQMATMPTTPTAPTGLVVTPAANGESATVTWAAPASNGGSPVTGYELTRTGGTPVDLGLVGTHTWTGLTPGSAYTFTVAAKNAVGTGAPASQAATMPTAPTVPTSLVVTPAANGQSATVTWAAPASDGGSPVTGYTLTRTGGSPVDVGAVGTHTWTGLTPGTTYTFTVAARNAVGPGPQASASASLPAAPGAPAITKATSGKPGGKKTAKVSWSAPASTGGTPVTGYQVLVFKKSGTLAKTFTVAAGVTSYQAKLTGGRYRFAIVALNAVGAGPQSALSRKVTAR